MFKRRMAALLGIAVVMLAAAVLAGCHQSAGQGPKFSAQWTAGDHPEGLAVDQTGQLLVVDTWNNHILRCEADGKVLATMGKHGAGDGDLERPARWPPMPGAICTS